MTDNAENKAMTLEKLRDDVMRMLEATTASDGECMDVATRFNAAIRERDVRNDEVMLKRKLVLKLARDVDMCEKRAEKAEAELAALSEMRELARDYERDRDKAEAELAALRKRIADAETHRVDTRQYTKLYNEGPAIINLPDELAGKVVRLLVEDDDAKA